MIEQWLSAGSIVACMAKYSADAASGSLLGILPNTPYSIITTKVLPGGTKLLRIHCPWSPAGLWQGPWSLRSEEWLSAESQAGLASDEGLAAGLQDEATFWCSYW